MNQRFQNAEIKRVSEQYAENELYKAVCSIGPQLENELTEFGLCSEECFMESLELLSVIADQGEEILPELDDLWLRKHNEYKRFDRSVSEDEIRKAVGIVFGFAILATDSSRHPFYRRTLSERLMETIATYHFQDWPTTLKRIFSVPLPDGWFDAFIDEEPDGGDDAGVGLPIPKAINTERAQKYFQKAIEKGYMKLENGKFIWLGVGGKGKKSQLAYFCGRVYEYKYSINGNVGTEFPEEELVKLFGVTRLYTLLTQTYAATKQQAWKVLIDDLFV